jgi:two-component sensor histidine kinase
VKKQKIFLLSLGFIILVALIVFSIQICNEGLYNAGLDITIEEEGFRVRKVAKESTAAKAGIQQGEYLVQIDQYNIGELFEVSEKSVADFLIISGTLFSAGEKISIIDSNNNHYFLQIPETFNSGNIQVINKTFFANLIIGVILIIMGGYFLLIGKESRQLIIFFLFTLFTGAAVVFSFFHSYWSYNYLFLRFIFLDFFGAAAGICLILFALSFPVQRIEKLFFWIPALFIPFIVKYFFIIFIGYSPFGVLGFLIHVYLVALISATIFTLIFQYKKSNAGDRRKIRWLFTGVIISIIPYLFYLSFLLIIQRYFQTTIFRNLILVANFSLLVFPLSIGIGIVNYKLFDIDLVLKKISPLILFGIFYVIVVAIVSIRYINDPGNIAFSLILITASVIGVFIYKKVIQFTNRLLFKHRQNIQDLYHVLGKHLVSIHDTNQVYQTVSDTMKAVYLPEFIRFISSIEGLDTDIEYIWKHSSISVLPGPSIENILTLESGISKTSGGGLIFPIVKAEDKWIFLEMGKRLDQDLFVMDDYNLLTTLAFQIAQALVNSALYEELQKQIDEKDLLIKEVHHRVKNNMQLISSLLNLQVDGSNEPGEIKILRASMNRIDSMALIHEVLYQSDNFAEVDMHIYIESIVSNLYNTYSNDERSITIDLQTENIYLNVDQAFSCGLIINELVDNSLKHSFLKRNSGILRLVLKKELTDFVLIVEDNGILVKDDFIVFNPVTLGLTLVSILVEQLNGSLDFEQTEEVKKFVIKFEKSN